MQEFHPKTIIEPFRIRSVEPVHFTTLVERQAALQAAGYNLFLLSADKVLIDLLTDSGTGAMSSRQWAGMISSDESYAGRPPFIGSSRDPGYHRLQVCDPYSPGRGAEHILFSVIARLGDVVPSNTHFDTTRAHVENSGAEARDLVIAEGRQPRLIHPFKGNMDLEALRDTIRTIGRERIPSL